MRCRACLGACGGGARALFGGGAAETLASLTGLQILPGDQFPDLICSECHQELCNYVSFIKKARESHEILCGNLEKTPKINGSVLDSFHIFDNEKSIDTEPDNGNKCASSDFFEELEPTDKISKTLDEIFNQTVNFCEKSTQVNFACSHQKANPDNEFSVASPDCNIITSDEFDKFNSYSLLQESEIKQEPEEDELLTYHLENIDNNLTVTNIKVEPLSENDALKFHQESVSDYANNVDCDNYVESSGINGYMSESLCSDGDIKPSEEELLLHTARYIMDDDMMHDNDGDPNSCNVCGKVLPDQMGLWRHIQIHKTHQICMLCNRCFRTRQRLKNHVVLHHSYGELKKCSKCDMSFKTISELSQHQETHVIPAISIPCNLCFKNFDSEYDLKEHMNYHREIVVLKKGNEELTLCSKCNKAFTDPKALFSHVKYVCQISELPNNDELILKAPKTEMINSESENISESRKNKVLKQNFNGKTFKKKSKEQSCPHCPQRFPNKYFLRIHLDQHSSFIRGFSCPICSFKFKRKDHLTRHLNNVHSLEKEKKKLF